MINIHDYDTRSTIYGPGKRFVIWVQGCQIRCKGCWNESMWSFEERFLIEPEILAKKIIETEGIEGVTILGGEPMHQAKDLLKLIQILKKRNLSIFLYTGYELHELKEFEQLSLFSNSDIVVSGRYVEQLRNVNLEWRGSSNQQIHFISERYINYTKLNKNVCEIKIEKDGKITISGYPSDDLIDFIKYPNN